MKDALPPLFTIGYSGFSNGEDLAECLHAHGVDVLIDVRSTPYSTHFPQFNKEVLELTLHNARIYYRNYAESFGARQENRDYYRKGRLDFEMFSNSPPFEEGMNKVEKSISKGYVLTLMCAEKDPITCHRAIMIARVFHEAGYTVIHIRPDHPDESHAALEHRLVELHFPDADQFNLFSMPMSFEEQLKEAYRLQNDEIGFKESNL